MTAEAVVRSDTPDGAPRVDTADATHFGGPKGAVALMVVMPLVSAYLWACIHRHGGALVVPALADVPRPTARAAAYFGGWLAFQVLLQIALPGKTVTGLAQRDGLRIDYKLNGLLSLVVSALALAGAYSAGWIRGADVLDELGGLLAVSIAFAFAFSVFLYFYGFTSTRREQRTGNVVYDFFMGTALNPRFGRFDLKLFFESKIGMTTWLALTFAMAAADYERWGSVSTPMILVVLFQTLYVVDFYVFESAMLSTWDINYENYGFMLAFAFLVWMPFNFSLQAQYLVPHHLELPVWAVVGLVALNLAGYYVFRTSNLQKHRFRTEPDALIWGKKPTFIQTKRGTRLLTSGFWGLARHTNYLGDLMMALAWCLPAGFSHVPPYFYFIYFAPLLIDRERRDHKVCTEKYGADWDTYCEKVRYRIIPGLY
jgi:protein-S-isoprenylcysteine O-methyltransferase Ste14